MPFVETYQKVTEREITIGNEMEILITLTKSSTRQRRGEGKPLLVVTT